MAWFELVVDNDQGLVGTSISGVYQPTPIPASLVLTAEAGSYLVSWYAEVMRTTAGGGSTIFARVRDVTAGVTLGMLRDGSGVDNGPPGAMPGDADLFLSGDVLPFSGSMPLTLPAGNRSYRLEYALSASGTPSEALRVRRQRIALLRRG
jgi:hypothetical protein